METSLHLRANAYKLRVFDLDRDLDDPLDEHTHVIKITQGSEQITIFIEGITELSRFFNNALSQLLTLNDEEDDEE